MWLGRLAAPPPRLTFPLQRAVLAFHDPRLDRVEGGARPMIGISLRQRRGRRWLSRRWLNDGRRGRLPDIRLRCGAGVGTAKGGLGPIELRICGSDPLDLAALKLRHRRGQGGRPRRHNLPILSAKPYRNPAGTARHRWPDTDDASQKTPGRAARSPHRRSRLSLPQPKPARPAALPRSAPRAQAGSRGAPDAVLDSATTDYRAADFFCRTSVIAPLSQITRLRVPE